MTDTASDQPFSGVVAAATALQLDKLAAALAKAQGKFKIPTKSHTVTIKPRDKQAYSYKYSSLDEIIECAREALAENGIAVIQDVSMERLSEISLTTTLLHESGQQWTSGKIIMPTFDEAKGVGSAITYARRYSLGPVLNIAAIEDSDIAGIEGDTDVARGQQRRPTPQRSPARAAKPREGADETRDAQASEAEPTDARPITPAAKARLVDAAKAHSVTQGRMKRFLLGVNIASVDAIQRDQYDDVMAWVQSGGPDDVVKWVQSGGPDEAQR